MTDYWVLIICIEHQSGQKHHACYQSFAKYISHDCNLIRIIISYILKVKNTLFIVGKDSNDYNFSISFNTNVLHFNATNLLLQIAIEDMFAQKLKRATMCIFGVMK
jgi:hypothetical protein